MNIYLSFLLLSLGVRSSAVSVNSNAVLDDVAYSIDGLQAAGSNQVLKNLKFDLFSSIQGADIPNNSCEYESLCTTQSNSPIMPEVKIDQVSFLNNFETANPDVLAYQIISLAKKLTKPALLVNLVEGFHMLDNASLVETNDIKVVLPYTDNGSSFIDNLAKVFANGLATIRFDSFQVVIQGVKSDAILTRQSRGRADKFEPVLSVKSSQNSKKPTYLMDNNRIFKCDSTSRISSSPYNPIPNIALYEKKDSLNNGSSLIIKIIKDSNLPPVGNPLFLRIQNIADIGLQYPIVNVVTAYGANAQDIKVKIIDKDMILHIPVVEKIEDLIINVNIAGVANQGEYTIGDNNMVTATLNSDIFIKNPLVSVVNSSCSIAPPSFNLLDTQDTEMLYILNLMKSNAVANEVSNNDMNKMAVSAFINDLKSSIIPFNKELLQSFSFGEFCKSFAASVSALAACEGQGGANNIPSQLTGGLSSFKPSSAQLEVNLSIEITSLFGDLTPCNQFESKPEESVKPTSQSTTKPNKAKNQSKPQAKKNSVNKPSGGSISKGYYVAATAAVAVVSGLVYVFIL